MGEPIVIQLSTGKRVEINLLSVAYYVQIKKKWNQIIIITSLSNCVHKYSKT